jgi:tetratricopeptide (TPR) repeat protein
MKLPLRTSLVVLSLLLAVGGGLYWLAQEPPRLPPASSVHPVTLEAGATVRQSQRDKQVALARSLVQESNYSGAVAALDRALEAMPGDAEALALQVRAFRAQRRYGSARSAAMRLQDLYPGSPLSAILLGSIAMQQGDSLTARRDLQRAVELDPASGQAVAQLAALDLMEGRVEEARWRAARALSLEPDNPTALRILARLVRSVPELITIHQRLLESAPDDTLTRSWLEILDASNAPEVNYVAPVRGAIHVPMELDEDSRYYVRVDVNSLRGLRMLVDTGASGMVLSETMARRMGMNLREFSESAGLGGLTRHSHPILIDRLGMGGMRARALMATASNLPVGVDGIINPVLFAAADSKRVMEFLPAQRRLVFRPGSGRRPPPSWVTVPFLADGHHIIFRIVLAGSPAMALLDTGAAVELVDRSITKRLPDAVILSSHEAGTSLIGFGGQIEDAETVEEVPLRIAGQDMVTRRLFLVDLNEETFRFQVDLDAIVGIARLQSFDIHVDAGAGTLSFRPLD